MTTINQLHSFENNTSVRNILYALFDVNSDDALIKSLNEEDDDLVWSWCNESDMDRKDLIDWIDASLDHKAKFKVLNDNGPAGGWPAVQLDLDGGVTFTFDWVTED